MKQICQICKSEETTRSMAMHLKWQHGIKTEEYIKIYGEFRLKNIDNNITLIKSDIKCNICNESMKHNRQLMYHITKKHKDITKEDYLIKYFYKEKHPICKCGCGGKVTIISYGKINELNGTQYHVDYIKGHWDWVKPNWIEHTQETKDLMRKIKIDKLKEDPSSFYQGVSKEENNLVDFISGLGFDIIQNDREILNGKELDILIPSQNTAIEYNGVYYHSDKFKDKNSHLIKIKECEKKGIRLIHIWESDWIKINKSFKKLQQIFKNKNLSLIHI